MNGIEVRITLPAKRMDDGESLSAPVLLCIYIVFTLNMASGNRDEQLYLNKYVFYL